MPIPRGISEASASRVFVAALLSLIVTGAVAYLGLHFSHGYTASIGLLGTLGAETLGAEQGTQASLEPPPAQLPSMVQSALTDIAVADIDRSVHPYTALGSKVFPKWTASQLRSHLSVENIYSGTTMGAINIVYSGNDRQTALAVTNAVADLLVRPRDPAPLSPVVASQPASQAVSAKPSKAPVEVPALAVEVAAPTITERSADASEAAIRSAQMEAIHDVREQLAAIAKNSQDLENQIQSGSDSLAAIEQEKEHLKQAALVVPPAPKPTPPPPDPKRALLQSKLAAYDKVLAALRDRYTEDYPDVINARERVEELQAEIAQLPPPIAPVVRALPRPPSDLPQRLAVLDERERPIEAGLEEMRAKLKADEAKAAQLRRFVTELPAKAAAARVAAPAVEAPQAAPTVPQPGNPPEAASGVVGSTTSRTMATAPEDEVAFVSRFSIATPAEIRKSEEILSPEAVTALSIGCGLGAGFAYLALGARRRSRKRREEPEPEAEAAVV